MFYARMMDMPFTKEDLETGYLYDLNNPLLGTPSERIAYAWEVYNSKSDEYQESHKTEALQFLTHILEIPTHGKFDRPANIHEEKSVVMQIARLMNLKHHHMDEHDIPKHSDLKEYHLPIPMEKIPMITNPHIKGLSPKRQKSQILFIQNIHADMIAINYLIDSYNATLNKQKKKDLLGYIDNYRLLLNKKYPESVTKDCPSYESIIQTGLLNSLTTERNYLHIPVSSHHTFFKPMPKETTTRALTTNKEEKATLFHHSFKDASLTDTSNNDEKRIRKNRP